MSNQIENVGGGKRGFEILAPGSYFPEEKQSGSVEI
jgi:hypothetical protein